MLLVKDLLVYCCDCSLSPWQYFSRVDSAREVARAWPLSRTLGLKAGMLVTVPNAEPADGVEEAIRRALREINDNDDVDVGGKEFTSFLLKRINELTDGDSLRSNIALVKRNARVGTEIAVAVANERRSAEEA